MVVRATTRRPVVMLALLSVLALITAACGTRESHDAVVAAAGGGGTAGPGGTGAGTTTGTTGVVGTTTGGTTTNGGTTTGGTTTGGTIASTTTGATTTGTTTGTATGATAGTTGTTASGDTTPVVICQVGHFSGIASPPMGNAQPALVSWVRWTNAHGGLAGHPIVLDSKDDTMDPNRAQQIVQNCVENEHAVALVAAMVPATVDSFANYVERKKIPVIGGDGVTKTWFTNPDFFPQGISQTGTANGMVRIMLNAHKKHAGIIYCTENVACSQGKDYFQQAAKQQGLDASHTYQVTLANPSFTSQCSLMERAHLDAIYITLDGPSASRLARDCNAIDYHPFYVTGGLALDADDAAADTNLDGLTITTSIFPWMTSTTPGARDFHKALSTYAPDINPTESAAMAWTAGTLLAKALDNVGAAARNGPITNTMILKGLHMVHHENLGGLVMGQLNFRVGKPVVPDVCWGVAQIRNKRWIAPQGAKGSCV